MTDTDLLLEAIQLADQNARSGGQPFGAVLTVGDEVVARGVNTSIKDSDPTAHAELVAIRAACKSQSTQRLPGATIYASCEPCPMCQSAALLVGVSRIIYAATAEMAAAAGFAGGEIRKQLALPFEEREAPVVRLPLAEARRPFVTWDASSNC